MRYELVVELGLTVLATVVSFHLIERPALKLKGRFDAGKAERKTSIKTSPELADAK